ncbi:M48 family metallopeptidase [Halohasta litorea]|uniref:M48 family metallopeptidase n=1 Tax=Halohasta litorea TaxID=869891 RepID=A0ABD6DCG8_9EURY|nr:M48 family metallopeptidase [Halohasta litorea]
MQYPELHAAFVVLLVGTQAFFTALAVLNVQHADRLVDRNAAWLADTLGIDDHNELHDYHRLTTAFSELQSWIGLAVLLVVLYAGALEWAVGLLTATGLSTVLQGVGFFAGLVVATQLFSLPFSIVSTFGIEEVFDFNQQTPRLFARDTLLTLGISLVFTAVLGGAVLVFISALPTLWPLAAWLLFVVFSLVMQVLYPRVIAPLFNDFDPVESGELRDAVEDVFERAGFSTSDIYTMDASRRSSQLNAYFIGFGSTKRVVLFDTLVESMEIPELQGVLAHELAHWKEAHIWKQFAGSAVRMGVVFAALGALVAFEPLYTAFGIPETATYAGLLLAALIVGPVLQFTAPLANRLSLKHEREADAFAADVMGAEPMIDALARLATENLANPFPHPWYATFHYSHPPIPERIRLLEAREDASEESTDLGGATPAND